VVSLQMFYVCYSAVSRVAVHIRRNEQNEKGVRGENAKHFTQVDTPVLKWVVRPENRSPDLWDTVSMATRNLRVVNWLSTVPAVGVSAHCDRTFKVRLDSVKRASAAQESLRKQWPSTTASARMLLPDSHRLSSTAPARQP
jgi:hypothetical protein